MLFNLASFQRYLTDATLELYGRALFIPMFLQICHALKISVWHAATWNLTLVSDATLLPMTLSVLVWERFVTIFAFELRLVQWLYDKPVHLVRKTYLLPAIRARVIPQLPRQQALWATQLIAMRALSRILNDQQADRTRKIGVQLSCEAALSWQSFIWVIRRIANFFQKPIE